MEEEIKIVHTRTKKKSRACWWACLIFFLVLVIGVSLGLYEFKKWFHEFAASARQATQQSQSSQ